MAPSGSAESTPGLQVGCPADLPILVGRSVTWLTGRPTRLERWLWLLALGVLGLDLATTAYGLHIGLREANPVAIALLERYGFWTLGSLKVVGVGVGATGWTVLSREHRFIVPLCLAGPWALGSAVNLLLVANIV